MAPYMEGKGSVERKGVVAAAAVELRLKNELMEEKKIGNWERFKKEGGRDI